MKRLLALLLLLIFTASPALASQLLEYTIRHPTYGDIGTYSNLIEPTTDGVAITSRLDITVKLLGLVAYREQSTRSEHWRDGRLVSFSNTTEKNGQRYELRGEARGDGFAVNTPRGSYIAPVGVLTSNPWSVDLLRSGPLLSTRDGTLLTARVSNGPSETIIRGGQPERLRRFDIESDKREYVWVDSLGVPVAFRTEDDGSPIDFILKRRETQQAAVPTTTADAAR